MTLTRTPGTKRRTAATNGHAPRTDSARPPQAAVATPTTSPVTPPPDVATSTTAAEATAAELSALGVECLFLMTGRDNTLWIALQKAGIRQILARTESAAVYMADGYARVTGRPAFVYGAYGPGAANVAGALAEPFWSTSPVVALCSAMRRGERYRAEYQEIDQPMMFEPVTKWAAEVASPAQLPRFIREAARRSVTGTPGPVYLGVPGDIYEDTIAGYAPPARAERLLEMPLARPAPSRADAEAVIAALRGAERPVLVAGNGIHQSHAHEALAAFVERLGIPVATSVAGKGSIAETHDLALGTVGRYSRNYANATLREADVVLALGTRLGGMVTDSYKLIGPGSRLFHVTVEADALGQNFPTELGIVADARSFLEAALAIVDEQDREKAASNGHAPVEAPNADYLAALADRRRAWRGRRDELARQDGTDGRPMRPESMMAALGELLDEDAIVCGDTGYATAWPGGVLELRRAGRNFFRADGSLGWSVAGAMGAQVAAPDRQVVAVIGDGGFGYHVGDIETAVRLNLPIVVVILNNGTLAFEAHVQTLLYDHLVPEVDDFLDVDYGAVARSFGANGVRVHSAPEFRTALADALERRVPTVIDAVIDRDAIAPVTRYDRVRAREL